jgi:hypothetical protein
MRFAMSSAIETIEKTLAASGIKTLRLSFGAGSFLFTVNAARLLVAELPGVRGNLFWHHPDVENPQAASKAFGSGGGNIGGDRLWLGPEIAYMWPTTADARRDPFGTWFMNRAMDPGAYQLLDHGTDHVTVTTDMSLTDQRSGQKISTRVKRTYNKPGNSPRWPAGVVGASFSTTSELTLLSGDPGAVACTWPLLQVPPGGWLICPTHQPVAEPRSYYNPWGEKLRTTPSAVITTVTGEGNNKFGLSPTQTTGRMGYLRKVGDVTTLIFRAFDPQPKEPYVDVPRDSDERFGGDALQSFNGGGFGEMEAQDPAIIAGSGPTSRTNRFVTHVIAGPDAAVREVASELLGVKLD